MVLNSGELTDRVTAQIRTTFDDEAGNPVSGPFEDVFTEPAKISQVRGREEVLAERLQGVRPAEIIVRQSHRTRQLAPHWRLVNARKREDAYNIHDVRDPDGKRRYLILTCTLGAPT